MTPTTFYFSSGYTIQRDIPWTTKYIEIPAGLTANKHYRFVRGRDGAYRQIIGPSWIFGINGKLFPLKEPE